MSFDTLTDQLTSEPSLMDIFGPDASEEAITKDKEAAMLSMADIAAVMNAETERPDANPGPGDALLTEIAKVGINALRDDSLQSISQGVMRAYGPELTGNYYDLMEVYLKRLSGVPKVARTLSLEPNIPPHVVAGNTLFGNSAEIDALLKRLSQELQSLAYQRVDLSDLTLSLSYRNPGSNRVVTTVLEEHEEDEPSYPFMGRADLARVPLFLRTVKPVKPKS